jgi:hypothetical protein
LDGNSPNSFKGLVNIPEARDSGRTLVCTNCTSTEWKESLSLAHKSRDIKVITHKKVFPRLLAGRDIYTFEQSRPVTHQFPF